MSDSAPIVTVAEHRLGDMLVQYRRDSASGIVGLCIVPADRAGPPVEPRPYIDDAPETVHLPPSLKHRRARVAHGLVQTKLLGDHAPGGHFQGKVMAHGLGIAKLVWVDQAVIEHTDGREIVTRLERPGVLAATHRLRWTRGYAALVCRTEVENRAPESAEVELLASFCLDGVTPFASDDAPGRLWLHRFQSDWSAEGRVESRLVEEHHLERSWLGTTPRNLRWGSVGSLPTQQWFPTAVLEDRAAGVCWAAQIAWHGSWQFDLYRLGDTLALSGGLADHEFGHWRKRLAPGERLESPPALLTCAAAGRDEACQRLTTAHDLLREAPLPAVEEDLPPMFNEWSTTWGSPSEATLGPILDRLAGTPVRYFVIDAGWYRPANGAPWSNAQGDWEPNPELFPQGLGAFAARIRACGLVPGLWFEFENLGSASRKYHDLPRCLHRDGRAIGAGGRRFLDFRQPENHAYLREKTIERLRADGFGYLKIDYNDSIGLGADTGDGAPGEGLRQHLLGVHAFLRTLHAELPDLVVENCSSGGYRLEPGSMARVAMGSFSDAHELPEIPVIAANLHRLIQPRQSQIWVVLHAWDSPDRTDYSLAAGFLGRLCLSGEIDQLSEAQWSRTREALAFYSRAAPTIKAGRSTLHQHHGPSWRHLTGWQVVVRERSDGAEALVVAHGFDAAPPSADVALSDGWELVETWGAPLGWQLGAGLLRVAFPRPWTAGVARLRRR